ncbi:four helix bundle protein [Candidatus Falkowbacteria bacterium]|nr:four helix bundle protein [Candidatus Falkowbacteria bacterium]
MLWHSFLTHLPRLTRYTLGKKIDELFVNILELALTAQYTRREDKLNFLLQLNRKLDNLKFFVAILWEAKGIDTGKYARLSQKLSSAGIMLGGWIKNLQSFRK